MSLWWWLAQQRLPNPYRCAICKRCFRYPDLRMTCCVNHAPGTCCHYGETEVPEEADH